jgi:hypothetical protein
LERPPAEEEKPKQRVVQATPESPKGDGRNINIGIFAGYGFDLGGALTALNPYGFGFGLQGDYELKSHIVVGIGGEFFIGGSDAMARTMSGAVVPADARYVLGHALAGYNFWFGTNMIIRPSLWVGTAIALYHPPSITGATSSVAFMLAPGVSFHYLFNPNGWYFGVDARFVVPLGADTQSGFPILLTLGKRF